MKDPVIRAIAPQDNQQIAAIIRTVLKEIGVPKVGTAYADMTLDRMYETYDTPGSFYCVIDDNGHILGGGGIAKLANYDGAVCELQKMYFLKEARGKGLGHRMIDLCLKKAVAYGFEKCYLETMPYMKEAQKLYKKVGFNYMDNAMGNTGHYSCQVWMLKEL